MLDADAIRDEAERRAGRSDPEREALAPHLERLVRSLNEDAPLTPEGVQMAHQMLVGRTFERLEGLRWVDEHPEIADESIEAPVFLTGLPRSGTTFFQYLFDRDDRFRLIRSWEAMAPLPPPGFDPAAALERKEEQEALRRKFGPAIEGLEAMHLMDADGPEECHMFMELSYSAAGFHNLFDAPSYFEGLVAADDFAPAYRVHARQLKLLQWRTSRPRWALKYPNHVLAMDAILDLHPTARFVMTHRDPAQIVASISKLTATLRAGRYEVPVDRVRVGRQMTAFLRRHVDRILAFVDGPRGDSVTHVDYYRLVDDPARVMAEVHHALGLDSPEHVRAAVADWHRRNPKGARGANPYALEEYGLDREALNEVFADYRARFDVPSERAGLGLEGKPTAR